MLSDLPTPPLTITQYTSPVAGAVTHDPRSRLDAVHGDGALTGGAPQGALPAGEAEGTQMVLCLRVLYVAELCQYVLSINIV